MTLVAVLNTKDNTITVHDVLVALASWGLWHPGALWTLLWVRRK